MFPTMAFGVAERDMVKVNTKSLQIVSPSDLCLKEVSFSGCGEIGPLCSAVRFTRTLIQGRYNGPEIKDEGVKEEKCVSLTRRPFFCCLLGVFPSFFSGGRFTNCCG